METCEKEIVGWLEEMGSLRIGHISNICYIWDGSGLAEPEIRKIPRRTFVLGGFCIIFSFSFPFISPENWPGMPCFYVWGMGGLL